MVDRMLNQRLSRKHAKVSAAATRCIRARNPIDDLPLGAIVARARPVRKLRSGKRADPSRPQLGQSFAKLQRGKSMTRNHWFGLLASLVAAMAVSTQAAAQQQQKPNILVIMGDDVG
jgi:hypothetical protein